MHLFHNEILRSIANSLALQKKKVVCYDKLLCLQFYMFDKVHILSLIDYDRQQMMNPLQLCLISQTKIDIIGATILYGDIIYKAVTL